MLRGPKTTECGNQDVRQPSFMSRGRKKKGRGKRKARGRKASRGGPLHDAMVRAAT